ncbi:MAG: CHRD domain-containing protein [Chitinophagaceae bacterium]|nr:CHRD domain-containing protein [Chitinophagaceae bacterium]MBL0335062.1 CHRD domain-containing protein [Chitinophagaceae bacterium]
MKWIKLTALFVTVLTLSASLTSCERDADKKRILEYSKLGIPMTGAQEAPASTSPALGTMDVVYRRDTRTLSYTVRYSGLSGAPIGVNIFGLAPTGYASPTVVQTILAASNPTLFPSTGTYTGFLFADGTTVKEADLLNGVYYMNIRTAAFPAGEIRGQIRFQ